MIMKITLIIAVLFALGCAQTINLGYVWDKNTEPDLSHYDLFVVTHQDSAQFWNVYPVWPNDSTQHVALDSLIHQPFLLATVAHIYSEIDTVLFEYEQPMRQEYLRAYLVAYDSVGNVSPMAVSWNAVFIGDRDSPAKPNQKQIVKFK